MELAAWQRAVAFIVGVVLVLGGVFNDEPRWAVLAVGLVLMGILSIDQIRDLIRR